MINDTAVIPMCCCCCCVVVVVGGVGVVRIVVIK